MNDSVFKYVGVVRICYVGKFAYMHANTYYPKICIHATDDVPQRRRLTVSHVAGGAGACQN